MATGQEGVWRLMHSECHTTHLETLQKMEDDLWNVQPENHQYILVKLECGE